MARPGTMYLFEYLRWQPLEKHAPVMESVVFTCSGNRAAVLAAAYAVQRSREPKDWRVQPRRIRRVDPSQVVCRAEYRFEAAEVLEEVWRYDERRPFLFLP